MNLVNESFIPFLNDEFLTEEYLNERLDLNSIKNNTKKALIISSIFCLYPLSHSFPFFHCPSRDEWFSSPKTMRWFVNEGLLFY
jgi:hypothetical protein